MQFKEEEGKKEKKKELEKKPSLEAFATATWSLCCHCRLGSVQVEGFGLGRSRFIGVWVREV